MSMAAKGTHYFPCTLARHNFCIFFRFVNSTFSGEYNCRKQLALAGFNPVLKGTWRSWPFRSVRLCRPYFLECAPGVPGSRKIGEIAQEDKKSQLCCDRFYYYLFYVFLFYYYLFYVFYLFYVACCAFISFSKWPRESRNLESIIIIYYWIVYIGWCRSNEKNVFGYAFFAIVRSLLFNKIQTWNRKIHEIYAACMHT